MFLTTKKINDWPQTTLIQFPYEIDFKPNILNAYDEQLNYLDKNRLDLLFLDKPTVDECRNAALFANISPTINKYKIIVIDKAEQINKSSSNSLLKLIEEPPSYVKIVLLCGHKKIMPTIKSRAKVFYYTNRDDHANNYDNDKAYQSFELDILTNKLNYQSYKKLDNINLIKLFINFSHKNLCKNNNIEKYTKLYKSSLNLYKINLFDGIVTNKNITFNLLKNLC
jgi:hypothetical protein